MAGKKRKQEKNPFKKFWNFVWYEDSLASWIVSLILAFIIVKFIFFPLLSLTFNTSLPLVVVESCSMYHEGNFNSWLEENSEWYVDFGLSEEQIQGWHFKNGLNKGDIILVHGWGKLNLGEIIIFNGGQSHPIIHRVISGETDSNHIYYSTKGDNNPGQLTVEEKIPGAEIVGRALIRVPYIGWIKLFFVDILRGRPISGC
ncbi:MAG: hypothetical protein ABIE22_01210 [archaeon]